MSKPTASFNEAGLNAYRIYQQQQQQYQAPQVHVSNNIELPTQPESTPDYLLPFSELENRAKAGNASAQFLVAHAFLTGTRGTVKNKDEGIRWLDIARNNRIKSSPGALCAEGVCQKRGYAGVAFINRNMAKERFQAAVDQGYAPAFVELACILEDEAFVEQKTSSKYGTLVQRVPNQPVIQEIIQLLISAANAKYPAAYDNLADYYASGTGVPQNHAEALKLYRLGADENGSNGSAYAKMRLGDFHRDGLGGLRQSKKEAKKYYQAARNQGFDIGDRLNSSCCTIS